VEVVGHQDQAEVLDLQEVAVLQDHRVVQDLVVHQEHPVQVEHQGQEVQVVVVVHQVLQVQAEAQEQVDQWIKTVGVKYFSELTNLGILMEEVGELSRIMVRKFGDQSFKNKEEEVLLADEMADVLWVLLCLANQTGVDLTTAFRKNMDKKTKRDADRHLQNPKLSIHSHQLQYFEIGLDHQ
jgi:NTP pyrophosphatase (non-canonical NTP hydrolase)